MRNWQLNEKEFETLSKEEQEKYLTAVEYKNHEWAKGPYGGWVRGNDLLKELGWTEQSTKEGHRTFVKLVKPEKFVSL